MCVAEQLATRLNWDEAFAANMPIVEPPSTGLYTAQYLQKDFERFRDRRDVRVLNQVCSLSEFPVFVIVLSCRGYRYILTAYTPAGGGRREFRISFLFDCVVI